MAKLQFTRATVTNIKAVGVPKTQLEKYELLKTKNPALQKLRETFGLDIDL